VINAGEQTLADQVVEGLEGEVRIDRAATVTDQEREVMPSRGSPLSITNPTCVRVPSRIR
jgi:hypothetical protein